MNQYNISDCSRQWNFFVKTSFVVAIISTLLGIYMLPGSVVIKGYVLISAMFVVFSAITLAKMIQQGHKSQRIRKTMPKVRASELIHELQESPE